MDAKEAAASVHHTLEDEISDELLAVGWYDGNREERTGATYLGGQFEQRVSEEKRPENVLDNALLERLGPKTHEMMNHETMDATTKFYQSFIDVHIHITDFMGVVVAVRRNGATPLRSVVSTVEDAVPQEVGLSAD